MVENSRVKGTASISDSPTKISQTSLCPDACSALSFGFSKRGAAGPEESGLPVQMWSLPLRVSKVTMQK